MEQTRHLDFVGSGWSFPLRIDGGGGFSLDGGFVEIDGSVRMILGTALGERVMRPDFGCGIWDLLFHPVNANTLGLMAQYVREALGRWEPRVELQEVSPRPDPDDPSRIHIEITYLVKATNDRRNLVFPFYVIPKEEDAP
ncbi:MAG: GPW/gp25 family protein [bacterium]|nr:GPW/gp25 family protein [bacterium]